MKTSPIAAFSALGGAVVALGAVAAMHAFAQPAPPPGYGGPQAYGAPGGYGPPAGNSGQGGYAQDGPGAGGAAAGGVTLAQFQARMRHRLMKADTDHDGRISLAEWTAWRAAHPGHGGAGQDPQRSFARIDTNGDGYITPDEIDAAAARRFARMDANHDGVLTPDERDAAHGRVGSGGEGPDEGSVQPLPPP